MKNTFKFLTLAAAALTLAGCSSRRLANQSSQPAFVPPPPPGLPPGAIYVPPGGSPPPGARPIYGVPPGAPPGPSGPSAPGGAPPFPVAPTPPAGPPMVPPSTSSAPAPAPPERVGYRWEAAAPPAPPPSPAPAPQPSQSASPNVLLLPPTPEPGAADPKQEPKQEPRKQLYTPEPPTSEPLPVGIAGYERRVRDNLAAGQRPMLEGLDWLQKQGFRNVIFLHLPADNIDADRQQVEKRGMTFIPIEINPRDLNRDTVDRFLNLQNEKRGEKTFVYDVDGSLSGAMWYLSFRLIDMDTDETARVKSGSLGQGENRDASRELWQAVKKFAEQQR